MQAEQVPLTYATVMVVATPVMRWWGRLTVVGQNPLPPSGPTLLMVNHDSARDPVVVAVAARRRQIRALAKASLWKLAPMGWVLDRMGQVPIERGRGHVAALSAAIDHLRRGQCIGVFPEGTVSRGRQLRHLSGAGRLALAVPGTRLPGVRITGMVDIVRFPRRQLQPIAVDVLPGMDGIRYQEVRGRLWMAGVVLVWLGNGPPEPAAASESDRGSERIKAGVARCKSEGKAIRRKPGAKDRKPRKRSGYVQRWENERALRTA